MPVGFGRAHAVQRAQDGADLAAEDVGVHRGTALLGRRGVCGRLDAYPVHLCLDHVGQFGLLLDEVQQQGLQLLALQPGQQRLHRGPLARRRRRRASSPFLHFCRAMQSGQQGRHDMFAPATPVIGATAEGLGDATGIVGDLHPVGLVLAALHLGMKLLVTAHEAQHRSLLIVLTATVIRVRRGMLADAGFGNFG